MSHLQAPRASLTYTPNGPKPRRSWVAAPAMTLRARREKGSESANFWAYSVVIGSGASGSSPGAVHVVEVAVPQVVERLATPAASRARRDCSLDGSAQGWPPGWVGRRPGALREARTSGRAPGWVSRRGVQAYGATAQLQGCSLVD